MHALKSKLGFLLKAGITVVLLYILFSRIDLHEGLNRLLSAELFYVMLALAILCLQVVLATYRWVVILRCLEVDLSVRRAIAIVLIGLFFNQSLPSTVGGDAIRIWQVAQTGALLPKAINSVLLDRITGLASMVLFICITLPLLFQFPLGSSIEMLLIGAIIGTVAFFVVLCSERIVLPIPKRFTSFASNLRGDARAAFLQISATAQIVGSSMGVTLLSVICLSMIALSLGVNLSLVDCLLLFPPVLLVTSLPISIAGWGVREVAMVSAFALVGVSETDALVLSIIFGLLVMIVGLPGGLVWFLPGTTHARSS